MKYKKTRISFLFLILNLFVLFSSGLFIEQVFKLQFSNSDYFRNQALSYREKTEVIEAKRGSILDKNFNEVADTVNAFNIGINPNKIVNKKEISDILSPLLKVDSKLILKRLNDNDNYFYLQRNVTFDIGMKIKKWGYEGIIIEPSNKRVIYSESLNKIIGHVDPDGNGVEGLELYFDNSLKGVDGELTYEAAPNGSVIPQGDIRTIDPIHGEDLLLSLDSDLQYLSEELCAEALDRTDAFKCSVVFANAETGEIIISAEKSSSNNKYFNINLISGRALYEPGSALKIFTIGSLLDEGLLNEDDKYIVEDQIEIIESSCESLYDGLRGCFSDFLKHETYELSVKQIIERSSNVGTIKITKDSSVLKIEEYLTKFGFGQKSGVELTGEAKGGFVSYKKCLTCLSSLSIGYSINVSQYQMIRAYSIIANGGKDVKLTLVQKEKVDTQSNTIISPEMSSRLKTLLINVVEGENGTGKSLRKEGYIIGGKTGTSRTHLEGVGYSEDRFNTSFTGFVETKDGPVVGSVLLWGAKTNPTSEYVTGGSTAAPIFKKIISYFVPKE
ncbi:MAG: penicillin-binding protein 2 [Candidatus Actinomarinales bacterium]|nr:MAG: penicillin-binding protein 2 [Candidatus Actinomarinales bacterium]